MGEPVVLDVPGYGLGNMSGRIGYPHFIHYSMGLALIDGVPDGETVHDVSVPVGEGDRRWVPVDAETGEEITHVAWADARLGVYCGKLPDSRSLYRLIRRPLWFVRRSELASLSSR